MDLLLVHDEADGVRVLTLNRPDQRNALSRALRDALVAALADAAAAPTVSAVVITGAGPSFCAGFDLKELAAGNHAEVFADAADYHRALHTFPKVLVAAVNGPALAGGLDLAALCDMRLASPAARFGQPQVRMGIPASYELMRSVLPEQAARELCLTGRILDADEAARVGLVLRVVADPALLDEAVSLAAVGGPASAAGKAAILASQHDLW